MTKKKFKDIFRVETDGQYWIMYKSVQDNDTDFYTGKIKYENGKIAKAPDWDKNHKEECGKALHLSPQPWMTQRYNIGKIKKCRVKSKDIIIYPFPKMEDKVRCRAVEVIEDYEAEK